MKTKEQLKEDIKFKNRTTWSYVGFVFQTFFKRPFGYIIATLYVLYLSIILLIVPAGVHLDPLFIWSNAAFNMPIFNLFFIAAASGALAVAVFRTGRDDGTELTLSSKPLTKRTMIFGKVFVYLVIMFGFTAITIGILALIYPVFGEYNLWTNITGITKEKYVGLLLSILVGNTVNMLLFGGISVLISMVGGQVITIIGSVGIAFLMCLLNVIFPIAISSPLDVLQTRYNTSINSMVANTRAQYDDKSTGDSVVKNFAAIQCITDIDGQEVAHFDTYEYWKKVNKESGLRATNYFDFGKQLSYIFSAFGVDEAKLLAASKLMIGINNSFYYTVDNTSHITDVENLLAKNYPFSTYSLTSKQGVAYPTVNLMAGELDVSKSNWYAVSTLCQADWNASIIASTKENGYSFLSEDIKKELKRYWFMMSELRLNETEYNQAKAMFNALLECDYTKYSNDNSLFEIGSAINTIIENNNNVFWTGSYDDLSNENKFKIISKIQLAWIEMAQDWQNKQIQDYSIEVGEPDIFPFESKTVKRWYLEKVKSESGVKGELFNAQKQIENIFTSGIWSTSIDLGAKGFFNIYPRIPTKTLEYCETFNNLYRYNVTSFYNVNVLILIWTLISAGLFTTAIIVYRRTDFK